MAGHVLEGIRVVEISKGAAASYCGKLFADFGAEVVKLEPPAVGDDVRYAPPFCPRTKDPERSGLFAYLNANKRSAALAVETPKGADLARRLCLQADVLIDGYGPGRLESMGPGFCELEKHRPELVWTSITWFGLDGPYRDFAGGDALIHALCGVSHNIGPRQGPPTFPGGYQAQIVGGLTGFVAAMGALAGRALGGGGGARLDVSILEANLCFTETGIASFAQSGEVYPRRGINRYTPTYPASIFPCRGGWIGVTVLTPPQWRGLCELIGRPELAENPDYATSLQRIERADELEPVFQRAFLDRTAEQWFHLAQSKGIPFAMVPTMEALLRTDHFRKRRAFAPIRPPGRAAFEAPAVPFRLLRSPALRGGASPRLGQHNAEVLEGILGLSRSEMAALRQEGVIG